VAWRAQLIPGVPGEAGKVALEACRAGIVGAGVKIGCCFAFAKVTGLLLEVAKLAFPNDYSNVEDGLKFAACQCIVHESSVGDGCVFGDVDGGSLCRDGAMRAHAHGIHAACSNVT
jgi:hypothetical protein